MKSSFLKNLHSILVLLKGTANISDLADRVLFTFHSGSIKGAQTLEYPLIISIFTFHSGSIKGELTIINKQLQEIIYIPFWFY